MLFFVFKGVSESRKRFLVIKMALVRLLSVRERWLNLGNSNPSLLVK